LTPQAPLREVPGAGSPLSQSVLSGPSRQALVLASFPTALYLSVGEHHEILPVLASDALMLPTAVRLSAPSRGLVWGVEPGDPVIVGRSEIRLPAWRVRLVRQWRPARVGAVHELAGSALLSEIADTLSCQASSAALVEQATAVCRAARCGDRGGVRRAVRRLLGAGKGLTPSGDDVLCAVLLVLNGVRAVSQGREGCGGPSRSPGGEPAPIALLGGVVQDHWSSTTSLSASLLDAARAGYAVPEVAALVEYALRGDLPGALRALPSTLDIGSSSGTDLVAGLAGALRALAMSSSPIPTR